MRTTNVSPTSPKYLPPRQVELLAAGAACRRCPVAGPPRARTGGGVRPPARRRLFLEGGHRQRRLAQLGAQLLQRLLLLEAALLQAVVVLLEGGVLLQRETCGLKVVNGNGAREVRGRVRGRALGEGRRRGRGGFWFCAFAVW